MIVLPPDERGRRGRVRLGWQIKDIVRNNKKNVNRCNSHSVFIAPSLPEDQNCRRHVYPVVGTYPWQ